MEFNPIAMICWIIVFTKRARDPRALRMCLYVVSSEQWITGEDWGQDNRWFFLFTHHIIVPFILRPHACLTLISLTEIQVQYPQLSQILAYHNHIPSVLATIDFHPQRLEHISWGKSVLDTRLPAQCTSLQILSCNFKWKTMREFWFFASFGDVYVERNVWLVTSVFEANDMCRI